ncbi:hypothetical protein HYU19_04355 [Candidatus Woesearchaeota archaeon]|nr:hypothetical protein [Candidatus Woesearchaeota archaeon]
MKFALPLLMVVISFLVLGCIPLREAPLPGVPSQAGSPAAGQQVRQAPAGQETGSSAEQGVVPPEVSPSPSMPSLPAGSPAVPTPSVLIQQPDRDVADDGTCDDRDGGIMPNEKGTVYRFYDGAWAVFTDICSGNTLLEHYCERNAVKTREILCEYGCSDSRCLSEPLKPAPEQPDKEVDNSKLFYNCYNEFRDTEETDVDCGGPDCSGCRFGKHCKENSDCADPLSCNVRMNKCSDFRH